MRLRRSLESSGQEPSAPTALDTDPTASTLLQLQQSAGNAAVAGLLARQPVQIVPPTLPDIGIGPGGGQTQAAALGKQDAETKKLIVKFLGDDRTKPLEQRLVKDDLSVPEIVDIVRRNVKEALTISPEDVARLVREWGAGLGVTFREHRDIRDKAGAARELVATIANALGSIPTGLTVKRHGAFLHVSTGSLELGYKKGEFEVKAESEWGESIGVSTSIAGVSFAAKLEPPKGHEPVKWEAMISFPEDDSMVPLLGSLSTIFSEANTSMNGMARELTSGRRPSDALAKEKLEPVKKGVEAMSSIAKVKGPAFGVKVEGEGPAVTVQATLTFRF